MSPEIIILGAGMAGASLAAEVAPHRRVLLLELEDQPGRHATGRSAAMFFESYGNATVRALTRASRAFLERPPEGFTNAPLLHPRSALFVADAEQQPRLDALLQSPDAPPTLRRISTEAARRLCPILSPQWLVAAAVDDSGSDIDVAALHQAYLRVARRHGAHIALGAFETTLRRKDGLWHVDSRAGSFAAPLLVNATGAWADQVARQAGVRPVGLQPMRRTAVTLPAPAGHDIRHWPLVIDVDETFYFKPDAGQLLLSPANEDPMEPCDVAPDEMDVAIAVDRFTTVTTVAVPRLNHRWAGLRSFVADRSPVAGFGCRDGNSDGNRNGDSADGFFWLAGQGGYGIQMAPALARAAAALVLGQALPADLIAQGVGQDNLSASRLALQPPR